MLLKFVISDTQWTTEIEEHLLNLHYDSSLAIFYLHTKVNNSYLLLLNNYYNITAQKRIIYYKLLVATDFLVRDVSVTKVWLVWET